jgi:gluconokinase
LIVVVMGVSGSGKTTIGKRLAARIGCEFADADDFHSADNKAKMRSGTPLNDEDRLPWLQELNKVISAHSLTKTSLVLACSALKQTYRSILAKDAGADVVFVYLKVDFQTLQKRLARRRHKFMNPKLLGSQFETLEEPDDAITVDSTQTVSETVQDIMDALDNKKTAPQVVP